jgi:hypothetical protein
MGVSASKNEIDMSQNTNDYFIKEFLQLNQIVNDVLSPSKTFKNNKFFNSLLKKRCDRFVLSSEDKLSKYSKIHLNELNTSISLIPVKESIKDKKLLCNKISSYYSRLLQILLLIKYVYDIENYGAYNIAGIIDKNIKQTKNNVTLKYCKSSQPTYDSLDIHQLSGFEFFVENFLTSKEQQSFMKIYQDIFNLKNVNNIDEMLCIRRIFENDVENVIFTQNMQCEQNVHNNTFKHILNDEKVGQSSMLKIHPKNPILSWKYCSDIAEIHCKTNQTRTHLKNLQSNYKKNLQKILDILDDIVFFHKQSLSFKIKQISDEKLLFIEKRLKQNIIQFYIRSIVDYKTVLQSCKK